MLRITACTLEDANMPYFVSAMFVMVACMHEPVVVY